MPNETDATQLPAMPEQPAVKVLPPRVWAAQKVDAIADKYKVDRRSVRHLLAGAYVHGKWERDHTGADMDLVSEAVFDAAIDAVATLQISNSR